MIEKIEGFDNNLSEEIFTRAKNYLDEQNEKDIKIISYIYISLHKID